jgi:hypothetical protein
MFKINFKNLLGGTESSLKLIKDTDISDIEGGESSIINFVLDIFKNSKLINENNLIKLELTPYDLRLFSRSKISNSFLIYIINQDGKTKSLIYAISEDLIFKALDLWFKELGEKEHKLIYEKGINFNISSDSKYQSKNGNFVGVPILTETEIVLKKDSKNFEPEFINETFKMMNLDEVLKFLKLIMDRIRIKLDKPIINQKGGYNENLKNFIFNKQKGGVQKIYKLLTFDKLKSKINNEELELADKSIFDRSREIFNKGTDLPSTDNLIYKLRPWDLRLISKHSLHNNYSYIVNDATKDFYNNSISEKYLKEGIKTWLNNMGEYSYKKFYNINSFDIMKTEEYLDKEGNIIDNPNDGEKEIIIKKGSNTFEPININGQNETSVLTLKETLDFILKIFNEVKVTLDDPKIKFKK